MIYHLCNKRKLASAVRSQASPHIACFMALANHQDGAGLCHVLLDKISNVRSKASTGTHTSAIAAARFCRGENLYFPTGLIFTPGAMREWGGDMRDDAEGRAKPTVGLNSVLLLEPRLTRDAGPPVTAALGIAATP